MKSDAPTLSRRRALCVTLAAAGLAATAQIEAALAALRRPTPKQSLGPFYPLTKPLDRDNDLTVIEGRRGRAQGRILELVGRIVDAAGGPVQDARIEIWQTNTFGRYHHPRDRRNVSLDPNFQGHGQDVTDTDGAYRFRTVVPAAYPASASWIRPPHIHFAVSGPRSEHLVTQIYFAGHALNASDYVLNGISDPTQRARLIVALEPPPPNLDPGSALATFDIVLGSAG